RTAPGCASSATRGPGWADGERAPSVYLAPGYKCAARSRAVGTRTITKVATSAFKLEPVNEQVSIVEVFADRILPRDRLLLCRPQSVCARSGYPGFRSEQCDTGRAGGSRSHIECSHRSGYWLQIRGNRRRQQECADPSERPRTAAAGAGDNAADAR